MAFKISSNTVVNNSRKGIFAGVNVGSYTDSNRPSASTGDLIYNSTEGKLQVFNGSSWVNVSGGAEGGGRTAVAVGGAVFFNSKVYHVMSSSGEFEFLSTVSDVEIITIAGGGGGGHTIGGGGGGGGFKSSTNLTVPAGKYTVEVGAGGAASTSGSPSSFSSPWFTQSGTAIGGGAGGNNGNAGSPGGSGGGGSHCGAPNGACSNAGSGTSGQGNAGGSGGNNGMSNYCAGGGGGAGGAGNSATAANRPLSQRTYNGAGGNGVYRTDISFLPQGTYFCAGGGGGGNRGLHPTHGYVQNIGSGGYHGGGYGAVPHSPAGMGTAAISVGSGGGGGAQGVKFGGHGSSGVVIVSYPGNTARG